ncbi:MAG: DUF3054 domain-containing protein [Chloroflexaceae bacterium]|nr:DUF3054 domain-containing protein [Chloroflexaceae bacterium]NJO06840.1 DUF3054 domain-containing protein [Chloroflexaceae bacterium]
MDNTHLKHAAAPVEQTGPHDTATRLLLIAGDATAFIIFAAIGRRSHGEAAGLAAIVEVFKTAAPFLLGWFIAAPWLRTFRPDHYQPGNNPAWWQFAGRIALAWVVALPVGLALRAFFLQRDIPISFAVVTFITNLLLLLSWRGVFAVLWKRRER